MRSVNHRNDPPAPRAAADHRSLHIAPAGDDSRLRRAVDIGVAMAAAVLLSLLLALIALLIKLDSPGPVLYRQQRVGKNGLPFRILKFRSMVAAHHPRRQVSAGHQAG